MRFGLYGIQRGSIDPAVLAGRARRAEEAGLESIWVGDHVALPREARGDTEARLDAVTALAYLAAVTSRVRLGFGVLVLPQRHPVLMAKQITSIDVLTGGRLIVGIAAGYVEPELRALGVPMSERGARTDEYLAAMRELWTADQPSFAGRFVSFDGVFQTPRPVQRPHPPIVVGGHSAAAMRRAVRDADGWYGVYVTHEETADLLRRLREVEAAVERPASLGELEITITPREPVDAAAVRRYEELGVHRLLVQPSSLEGGAVDEVIDELGRLLALPR
jgi:probable F420-dependent oxidoreductase